MRGSSMAAVFRWWLAEPGRDRSRLRRLSVAAALLVVMVAPAAARGAPRTAVGPSSEAASAGPAARPPSPEPALLPALASYLPWSDLSREVEGSWAEYALLVGGYPVGPYLRFLVVGREAGADEVRTWVEVWISQRPGSATQAYKLLVGADGRVHRAFARLVGGPVREIPPGVLVASGLGPTDPSFRPDPPAGPTPAACAGGSCSPSATAIHTAVQTPAGTFRARLAELGPSGRRSARAWFSREVPLFGLVRLELAGEIGLELHAFGAGGSSVVATPGPPAAP